VSAWRGKEGGDGDALAEMADDDRPPVEPATA
jgi:hypothetical protein